MYNAALGCEAGHGGFALVSTSFSTEYECSIQIGGSLMSAYVYTHTAKLFVWVDKICENHVEKQKSPAVMQISVEKDQMSFPLCNKVLLNSSLSGCLGVAICHTSLVSKISCIS